MKNLFAAVLIAFSLTVLAPPVWSAPAAKGAASVAAKVNINKASNAELEKLPGVGAVTAKEIVAYRAKHGNFRSADDLLAVRGVGKKTLEKIRPMVTTEE